MNPQIALLAFGLNSVFLANAALAVCEMAQFDMFLAARLHEADMRSIDNRLGRQARARLYNGDDALDELIDATPEIIDHAAYGMSIFVPDLGPDDDEINNVLADIDEDEDFRLNVDDMRCAFERFDNPDDREYASGLYS